MPRYECKLRPDLLEKAVRELNEPRDNAERLKAIDALRGSFDTNIYGSLIRSDDGFLLRFLRARKFNLEKALMVLQNYHTIRKNFREVFSLAEHPHSLKPIMDTGFMFVVDGKAKGGESVIIYQPNHLSQYVSLYQVVAYGVVCVEELLEDEEFQICGGITVDDLLQFNKERMGEVSVIGAKKLSSVWQDAMPVRMRNVYIFNQGLVMEAIFALFKPFWRNKLMKRIQLHEENYRALHAEVDPCILPPCFYGTGLNMKMAAKQWVKRLEKQW
ncbi:alpha-tocopherol transfer protein-like [Clavelina lepadiformis]|uniref:alpha-tocopherol transfer protein-like n=1 Tax=Clavelina lepadiformis TaxID=159417 RepID=UPI004042A380